MRMAENSTAPSISDVLLSGLLSRHQVDVPLTPGTCEFVDAGSFIIKKTQEGFVAALLGAGVGVALQDRTAGVGGIASLLLPEAVGRCSNWCPGNYADSGLPLFIEKLVEAGASRERLEARVAGGSCFGHISGKVASPNLGGQTADVALAILQRENIPVHRAETGGTNHLTMLLDTRNWQVSIELLQEDAPKSESAPGRKPTADEIEQAIAGVKPIPQVALKIIKMLGSDIYVNFSDLAEELKRDQVIAAKVLRFANSVLFGANREISSIETALVRLGERNLLQMIASAAIDFVFSGREKGYALMRGGLYRHALGVAYAAKEIAQHTGWVDPGTAYTCGLVHDIGKVVLDRFVAESRPFFYREATAGSSDFIEVERRVFGVDHAEAGKRLALQWNLPEPLAASIAWHHDPERASPGNRKLAHIVYLADLLATAYLAGMEIEKASAESLDLRLDVIGLNASQLPMIIDNVPWKNLMYM
jgi:putative nucleotidyltransferase with HDIG domain